MNSKVNDKLDIWTVYFNPKGYPGQYVVRKWEWENQTDIEIIGNTLQEVRSQIPPDLKKLDRQAGEDTCIVESWFS